MAAAIPTVPFGGTLKKHVLIMGSTGVGKTVIANMLTNNGFSIDDCEKPGKVGHGSNSGTMQPQMSISIDHKLLICDSVGLGARDVERGKALDYLKTIYKSIDMAITCVIVVAKFNRWTAEETVNMRLIDKVFRKSWRKQSVLVLTGFEHRLEDRDEELRKWYVGDEEVQQIVRGFAHVIVTNNTTCPMVEGIYRPHRESCLLAMQRAIQGWSKTINVQPPNLWEALKFFVQQVAGVFGIQESQMRLILNTYRRAYELASSSSSVAQFHDFGECAQCHAPIPINELVVVNCGHSFHWACIDQLAQDEGQLRSGDGCGVTVHCPLCRERITTKCATEVTDNSWVLVQERAEVEVSMRMAGSN